VRRLPLSTILEQSPIHRLETERLGWNSSSQLSPLRTPPERLVDPSEEIRSRPPIAHSPISPLSHFTLDGEPVDSRDGAHSSPHNESSPSLAEPGAGVPISETAAIESMKLAEPPVGGPILETEANESMKCVVAAPSDGIVERSHREASGWLTPTNIMIGLVAIFVLLKSNSRI
jgi:hypothetical protein